MYDYVFEKGLFVVGVVILGFVMFEDDLFVWFELFDDISVVVSCIFF